MKEYIEREALNKVIDYGIEVCNSGIAKGALEMLKVRLEPAADVVEVIRCKDCVCGYKTQNGQILCKFLELGNFIPYVKPNDYCSYGERMMDKEE